MEKMYIWKVGKGRFHVLSENGEENIVEHSAGVFTCTCTVGKKHGRMRRSLCEHALAVLDVLEGRAEEDPVFARATHACEYYEQLRDRGWDHDTAAREVDKVFFGR